ncbi:restriction endonuclease subunit S [Deinococcus sp. YIM 134068]|uniref:restriction endonuclease subunit S n=1 Tax=Deinococcus lichenicola TaxID=3118910 RepID=UPI002F955896
MPEWERVRLGEVLELKIDAVPVAPEHTYKISGVYSFGRGLIARGPLSGAETSYKVFHRLHTDDFVLSQLKGWEGALARVTPEFDGWFLSPQFPTFRVMPDRLDIEYLELYCKQASVWDELRGQARGMGARRDSVSPARFLALDIPLPPLPEQRRIVARVQGLLGKVEEARGLRGEAGKLVEAFQTTQAKTIFDDLTATYPSKSLGEMAKHVTSGPRDWGSNYTDTGWRFYRAQDLTSVGRISEHNKAFIDASNDRPSARVKAGDLLMVITGATVGRCALFQDLNEPGYISQHVALCRLDQDIIDPEFVHQALLSPLGQSQLLEGRYGQGKPGLNLGQIKNLRVPVPPLNVQRQVLSELHKHRQRSGGLRALGADSQVELDALPASILARAFAGAL